jgi:hypothetical protein
MAFCNELRDFVGTPSGAHVFVLVGDRTKFDSIRRPRTDHGRRPDGNRVLIKRIEQDGITVIFHHWISEDTRDPSTGGAPEAPRQ